MDIGLQSLVTGLTSLLLLAGAIYFYTRRTAGMPVSTILLVLLAAGFSGFPVIVPSADATVIFLQAFALIFMAIASFLYVSSRQEAAHALKPPTANPENNTRTIERELQQQNRELSALLQTSEKLVSVVDLQVLLQSLPNYVVDTLEMAEGASVWLYVPERRVMVATAWVGHSDDELRGLEVDIDTSLIGLVYESRQPVHVADTHSESAFSQLGQRAMDRVRTVLCVPMMIDGDVVGAIYADNFSQPYVFDDGEMRLLQALANQASLALRNTRLYSELRTSEARYRQLVEELPAITYLIDAQEEPRLTFISPQVHSVLGLAPEALLKKPELLIESIPMEQRRELTRQFLRSLSTGTRFQRTHQLTTNDGKRVWVENIAVPLTSRSAGTTQFQGVIFDISRLKETQNKLSRARSRLQRLSRELISAQEKERRFIAGELHDEIGQTLTATKMALQNADAARKARSIDVFSNSIAMVSQALDQVRNLSRDLRPAILDDLGLLPALRWSIDRLVRNLDLEVIVESDNGDNRFDPALELAAFRVIQEALTNIVKHAEATKATVLVRQDGPRLEVTIRDDGKGFDVTRAQRRVAQGESLGLLSMRERVELLGGRFTMQSQRGVGSEIFFTIPFTHTVTRS